MFRVSRLVPCLAAGALLALAPGAQAAKDRLQWRGCRAAANVRCADYSVPRDYDRPDGPRFTLHVAKSPATDKEHRIGSLFINFGGPGAVMAKDVEQLGADLFPALNRRFDLIGVDPRGVGQSRPAIDCQADQQTQGIYSEPFPIPLTLDAGQLIAKDQGYISRCLQLNPGVLQYVSTANVARDFDRIRKALGEAELNYLGFSYGTFLGATYASLFPRNYRAMVLDGPVDATRYVNDPLRDLSEQSAAFERAFGRFIHACAAHQDACGGFGGGDPGHAFDQLAQQLDNAPLQAAGYSPDPRPVSGDDLRAATSSELYSKPAWSGLATALAAAQRGDGSGIRRLVDEDFYGRDPATGAYDPVSDRYFTIGAAEQRYPADVGLYLHDGARSWSRNAHFWFNNGYVELNYGLYPVQARDAFYGPFKVPGDASTPLVVATTYDPATPYRGARRLVADLGNARLLTMRGDGHTAYRHGSPCIDAAVERYLNTLVLPAGRTRCKQDAPFAAPHPQTLRARARPAPFAR